MIFYFSLVSLRGLDDEELAFFPIISFLIDLNQVQILHGLMEKVVEEGGVLDRGNLGMITYVSLGVYLT